MTDAKVIAMGEDRPRTPGARSVLVGADRASGERVVRRRRTTPLLDEDSVEPSEPVEGSEVVEGSGGPEPVAGSEAAKKPAPPSTTARPMKSPKPKTPRTPKPTAVRPTPQPKPPSAKLPKPKPPKPVASVPDGPAGVEPDDVALNSESVPSMNADPIAADLVDVDALDTGVDESIRRSSRRKRSASQRNSARRRLDDAAALDPDRDPDARTDAGSPDGAGPADGVPGSDENPYAAATALLSQAGAALLEVVTSRVRPAEMEARVASILGFLARRLSGEYELDDFGFDPEFAETIPLALLRPLYKHWFRVEVRGIENLPSTGGALIVANHSGAVPIDALMASVAVHEEHPEHRFLRILGADLVFQTPFLAGIARRSGSTLASNPDAERLLADGNLVGVWPEGFKGIGKPFTERYKLQRFGRGGFVSAALRTGTPIVPCSIVGAEETYPIIGNVPSLARLLGLPYLPITPFFPLLGPLGMIPLPSKWLIEFGTPVPTHDYEPAAAEDPMLVFDLTDQIRQSIQQTLYSLLVQRRSIFF